MAIVKLGMSHWPGNNGKMTSHGNLKVNASKSPGGVGRDYLC